MGWSEEQTLNSTLDHIRAAQKGRVEMLQAIFGGPKDEAPSVNSRPFSIDLFDAMFDGKPIQ